MENTPSAEAPFACTLKSGEFKERLAWIGELNRLALLSTRRDGLRLILTYRQDCAESVREMVRREQQCCAFLGFSLTQDRDRVTLSIEAPREAADALDAIFAPFLAASRQSASCRCSTASTRTGATNDSC